MTPKDRVPPTLLTDLYQLTMAYGYWKEQMLEHEAIFHLSFRQDRSREATPSHAA